MTNRRTVQVAVEAIINEPEGYEDSTLRIVLADAEEAGLSSLLLDQLRPLVPAREYTSAACDCGEPVDIDGPLEDAHFVFAVRHDGTRSNLGECPRTRGFLSALQRARETFGGNAASYGGRIVLRGDVSMSEATGEPVVASGRKVSKR